MPDEPEQLDDSEKNEKKESQEQHDELLDKEHAELMFDYTVNFIYEKQLESDETLTLKQKEEERKAIDDHQNRVNDEKRQLLEKDKFVGGYTVYELCEGASKIEDPDELEQAIRQIEEETKVLTFAESAGPRAALLHLAKITVYELKLKQLEHDDEQVDQFQHKIDQERQEWIDFLKRNKPGVKLPELDPQKRESERKQFWEKVLAIKELREQRAGLTPEFKKALEEHPNLSEKLSPSAHELDKLASDAGIERIEDDDEAKLVESQGDLEADAKSERSIQLRSPESRTQERLARIDNQASQLSELKNQINADIARTKDQINQDLGNYPEAELPDGSKLVDKAAEITTQLASTQSEVNQQFADFERKIEQRNLGDYQTRIAQLLEQFDEKADQIPDNPDQLEQAEALHNELIEILNQVEVLENQLREQEQEINEEFEQAQSKLDDLYNQQLEQKNRWDSLREQAAEKIKTDLEGKLDKADDIGNEIKTELEKVINQAEIRNQLEQSMAEVGALQNNAQKTQTLAQEAQTEFYDQDAKDLAQEAFNSAGEAFALSQEAANIFPGTELNDYLQAAHGFTELGNQLHNEFLQAFSRAVALINAGGEQNILDAHQLIQSFESEELPKLAEQKRVVEEKYQALQQKTIEFNQKKQAAVDKYIQANEKLNQGKEKNRTTLEDKYEKYILKLGQKDADEQLYLEKIEQALQNIDKSGRETIKLTDGVQNMDSDLDKVHVAALQLLSHFQARPQHIQDAVSTQMTELGQSLAEVGTGRSDLSEANQRLVNIGNNFDLQPYITQLGDAKTEYRSKVLEANIIVANKLRKVNPDITKIDKLFNEVDQGKQKIDQLTQQIENKRGQINALQQEAQQKMDQAKLNQNSAQSRYESAQQGMERNLGEFAMKKEDDQRTKAMEYLEQIEDSGETGATYDLKIQEARRRIREIENNEWVDARLKKEITARLNLFETHQMVSMISGDAKTIADYFERKITELSATNRLLTGENLAVLFKENLPDLKINDAFMLWQEANRWEGLAITDEHGNQTDQIRFNKEGNTDQSKDRVVEEIVKRLMSDGITDRHHAVKSLQLARKLATTTFEDAIWDQDLATGNPLSRLIYFKYHRRKNLPDGLRLGPDLTSSAIEGFGTSLLRSSKLVLTEDDYSQADLERYASAVSEKDIKRENGRIVNLKIKMLRKSNIDHGAEAVYTHDENGNYVMATDRNGNQIDRTSYYNNSLMENRRGYVYAQDMDLESLSSDVWGLYAKNLRRNLMMGELLKKTDWMPQDVTEGLLEQIGELTATAADPEGDLGLKFWLTAGIVDSIAENSATKKGANSWAITRLKKLLTNDVTKLVNDRQIRAIYRTTKVYSRVRWSLVWRAVFGEEFQVV
jgi:predicted nucleic acid-binding protein